MKKLLSALALSTFIGTQTVSAQEMRQSLKDSLQTISHEMYQKGSSYYIVVDAVKDGILKLDANAPFEFYYQDKTVRFKDVKLSAKQQKEYTQKFQVFLKTQQKAPDFVISLRGDGVKMSQLTDPASFPWKAMPDNFQ